MKEVRARTPHTETHKIPMSPVFFFAIPRPSRGQKSRLRNRCTIRYHYWRTSYSWNFWHSLCLSVLAKPSPPAKRYRARFFYLLVFLIILFFFWQQMVSQSHIHYRRKWAFLCVFFWSTLQVSGRGSRVLKSTWRSRSGDYEDAPGTPGFGSSRFFGRQPSRRIPSWIFCFSSLVPFFFVLFFLPATKDAPGFAPDDGPPWSALLWSCFSHPKKS